MKTKKCFTIIDLEFATRQEICNWFNLSLGYDPTDGNPFIDTDTLRDRIKKLLN